jgi:hypothetical protein
MRFEIRRATNGAIPRVETSGASSHQRRGSCFRAWGQMSSAGTGSSHMHMWCPMRYRHVGHEIDIAAFMCHCFGEWSGHEQRRIDRNMACLSDVKSN